MEDLGEVKEEEEKNNGRHNSQPGQPGYPGGYSDSASPYHDPDAYAYLKPYKLLRREPLLLTVKWVNIPFGNYMALVEAHIGQQTHLDYILDPIIHSLWFKHGSKTSTADVLGMDNIMNVSQDIKYISDKLFH